VIIVFMFLAGANFALHYRFAFRGWKIYRNDREFLVYLTIIGLASALIYVANIGVWREYGEPAVRDTIFQVVSIQTTTGFITVDYEQWPMFSQLVLFLLMFIGGSAGSTGGGIKVLRIYLLLKFVLAEFSRLLHPHAIIPVRVRQQTIPRDVVMNVLGFFVLYMLIFAAGTLLIAAMGYDVPTSFGAVAATLGNVGPGLGEVGAIDNYAHFPPAGKWILAFLMLLGRLELYTVLILFVPAYWRR